jgi:protein-L-isoaspartate(D-aspartate) O-methyltransferase
VQAREVPLEEIFTDTDLSDTHRAAFRLVPRAPFVPEELRPFAHENRSLPLAGDAVLPSHSLALTLLRIARSGAGDGSRALVVGAGGGYLSALLRAAGAEVTLAETVTQLTEGYRTAWEELGVAGIELLALESLEALRDRGRYDAVIIHGGVRRVPEVLFSLLADGGVLAAPLTDTDGGYLLAVYRDGGQPSLEAVPAQLFPAAQLELR